MGEAFIFGSGGGATVEHIVMTNATSHTFQLTNPKRTSCKVFGQIHSGYESYEWYGPLQRSYADDYILGGDKYAFYRDEQFPGSYDDTFEVSLDTALTRDDNSVTITLKYPYKFEEVREWESDLDDYVTKLRRTNTIDIYVVDYD